jgi:hypothetical protein
MRVSKKTVVTCSKCGAARHYFPSAAAKLAGSTCAACRHPPRITLKCPECGRARAYMPSVVKVRQSALCRSCATSAAHTVRRLRRMAEAI